MMLTDILVEKKALFALVSSLLVIVLLNHTILIGLFMCDEKILFITKSDVVGQRREQTAIGL